MNIALTLSVDEINLVLTALSELPYRASAQLIDKLKSEAQKQIDAAQTEAAPQA